MSFALIIFELVVMVLAISLHDCAQAWAANRMGDPTAKMLGRMSLNPAMHFNFFGMVLWPLLFIFQSSLILGWGKPVPMTPRNFRKPSRDEMVATLAGPAAQFGVALLCLIVLIVLKHVVPEVRGVLGVASHLAQRNLDVATVDLPGIFPAVLLLYFCILVNLLLCVFNLMPLPYLDGGKILLHYLPYNAAQMYQSMGMYLMFGFMFLGFGVILMVFQPLMAVFNHLLNVM